MRIDLTTPVCNLDGTAVLMNDKHDAPEATLKLLIQSALVNELAGDADRDGSYKAAVWNLALDTRADEVDWTPEQIVIVRERVSIAYGSPLVAGQVLSLLQ